VDIDRLIIGRVMAVFAYLPRDSLHGPDLLQKLYGPEGDIRSHEMVRR
jgi:hypothetical protein